MKLKDFLVKIGEENAKGFEELKSKAEEKGLIVRLRTYEMPTGEFCIFIYDKAVKQSYMVGYDGYIAPKFSGYDFAYCLKESLKWVADYKRKS